MKAIVSIIIYILSCYNLFSQNFEITYTTYARQKFNTEDAKKFDHRPQGKEQLKANEEPPSETYKLIISKNESSFIYQDRISNNQDQIFDIRYPVAGTGIIYRNIKDSIERKDLGEIYGKSYHSLDSLKIYEWEISKERKKILGFEAYKAIANIPNGISVIAWFTPEINISHGPGDFWGLPGLILEIEKIYNNDKNRVDFYFAELIKEIKNPKIKKPNKGMQIKESDLERIFEEGRKRRMELESQGIEKD